MRIQQLTLIDLVVVINCKLIQTDMDEDLSKEVEPVRSTIPASIEIDVNSPIQEGSPSLSVDGNASIQDASPAMTGGINPHYQPNMLHLQPHNVNFVMGPNGQMIAIEKPPFIWKQFFIGGGIPFLIYFVPLVILMIGNGLGFDEDYGYDQVQIMKEENTTMYRGEFTIDVEEGENLDWCSFRTTDRQDVDLRCEALSYSAEIFAPVAGETNSYTVVGNWSNSNGTIYFDSGIDYGDELQLEIEYGTEAAELMSAVGDISGLACCFGFLLSLVILIVGFSQGKPAMGWGGVAALAGLPFASVATLAVLW